MRTIRRFFDIIPSMGLFLFLPVRGLSTIFFYITVGCSPSFPMIQGLGLSRQLGEGGPLLVDQNVFIDEKIGGRMPLIKTTFSSASSYTLLHFSDLYHKRIEISDANILADCAKRVKFLSFSALLSPVVCVDER